MGGYVSLVAAGALGANAADLRGLFLMAPALYMAGYQEDEYATDLPITEIVHGWSDDVVLPEKSIRYAESAHCALHLIDGDHGLNGSIEQVGNLFTLFLKRVT